MKVLYPASHDIPCLPDSHLSLKISRHSRCSACSTCLGLHPPPGWRVFSDASDGSDSDDDGEPPSKYLDRCRCGHGVLHHGADMTSIGPEEFARRGRVAVRLDELLEVSIRIRFLLSTRCNGLFPSAGMSVAHMSVPCPEPSVAPPRTPDGYSTLTTRTRT